MMSMRKLQPSSGETQAYHHHPHPIIMARPPYLICTNRNEWLFHLVLSELKMSSRAIAWTTQLALYSDRMLNAMTSDDSSAA